MQTILDERLRLALSAPTSKADAQDTASVTASGVQSLEGIQGHHRLRRVVLEGCDLPDLAPLCGLPALERLVLRYSRVPDLGALSACRSLRHLEISFCSSDDLAPLHAIPDLRTADLAGCPWADDAQRTATRALAAKLDRLWCSMDREWQVARELHEQAPGSPSAYDTAGGSSFDLALRAARARCAMS